MSSWSTQRKYLYLIGFAFLVALVVGVPSFLFFYKAPTCFDGKQNGTERGVDCGGACARLCPADFAAPKVLWSYSIQVVPGIYNAIAYIQNPNNAVQIDSLPYQFKLYDDQGILVAERDGSAFVPAGQKFAVFEATIDTGKRVPARTTFEFAGTPEWKPGAILSQIRVLNTTLTQGAEPAAQVDIENSSVDQSFSNVYAFIILYDKDGNRISFSRTLINSMPAGQKGTIYYTWPEALPAPVVRTEVIFVKQSAN